MPRSFPGFGHLPAGWPLACAGRPTRLLDNSASSEKRGSQPRADGASAPPKRSDISLVGGRFRFTFTQSRFALVLGPAALPVSRVLSQRRRGAQQSLDPVPENLHSDANQDKGR
jgi:hypothetical protein